MTEIEDYLVVDEVAAKLHVKTPTVTSLARRGELRASKRNGRWYFLPEDVRAYIDAGMNRPADRRRRRRAA